jgi:hypothetical protein
MPELNLKSPLPKRRIRRVLVIYVTFGVAFGLVAGLLEHIFGVTDGWVGGIYGGLQVVLALIINWMTQTGRLSWLVHNVSFKVII